ncbi:hypothetical protein [Microbacterium sp. 2FI]|uniref:hypothetical protein n=1 Tax=Microbacterium sp. 2FI TaxID=2502193 RepID=UPI0010F7A91F|nr:hypothetical protein [Microbacterium sp. 2FI]
MTPPDARPRISVVQPEGWVRLRIDDAIEAQIADLSATIARTAEPARRDLVRTQVRRALRDLASAASAHAYEVWMPVAPTGGVTIPVTFTVGPMPAQPDPARDVADVLLAFAAGSAGARALEVGGRLAVRTAIDIAGVRDDAGAYTQFPRRRVIFTVSPAERGGEWLAFLAEIIAPDADEAAAITDAGEYFVDALMATVTFGDETIADAAARARAALDGKAEDPR